MPLLQITNGVTRHPDYRLAEPLNLTIEAGETLAICGPNGGGKSLLVDIITGAHPLLGDAARYDFGDNNADRVADNVRLVTFRDVYGGNEPAYYQQRWNQADEQTFPTVSEVLQQARTAWTDLHQGTSPEIDLDLLAELGMDEHADKPINQLSSGELRRMQLAKMLMSCPQMLVIDNPYIGLDKYARVMLTRVLGLLAQRLTLVLVVSRPADVPSFVKHIVYVDGKRVSNLLPATAYAQIEQDGARVGEVPAFTPPTDERFTPAASNEVIDFRHINIRYGQRTILKDLNWLVMRGEHWALTGENGAGKSTLLSLVCADNPQAYACDIRLFGNKRGSGESIWDIKRRIGYVSPEMYSAYRKPLPAIDIVASGLRDTIGLYQHASEAERACCKAWLAAFDASHLADRNYMTLSSGEQRLIMLVRAFVKNPDLLILDEPFHGLDNRHRKRAQAIIDCFMRNTRKTLIMVTHYEEELPSCIDHRLVLKKHR